MDISNLPHRELQLMYEKAISHSTVVDLAAYCDVHDLIAIAHSQTQDIVVYRISGQEALTIKCSAPGNAVSAMKWKPDGSLLGVGWTDGTCGVYSGETGKLLSQSSIDGRHAQGSWRLDLAIPGTDVENEESHEVSVPTCIGWTTYISTRPASSAHTLPETTEDWFEKTEADSDDAEQSGSVRTDSRIAGLVDSITTLDVTKVLPKLSAIPSHGARHGADGSKFSTQASVDSIFESSKAASGVVVTLVTSGTLGHGQVQLDESVKIGTFDLQHKSLMHASHPQCLSHVILSDVNSDNNLSLHYLDLPLETLGGALLQVIARNTKRLQNLADYVKQTVRCMQHDFTAGLQFPSRWIDNISEELSEKQEGDLATNLYHLAMTGHFTPTMLEWFTDVIKENNHKRWDQAVNTMYANLQNHVFVHLLPALDRVSMAASALRGHARFHEGTSKFDVSPDVFTAMLDHIDSLRLVAQKMQIVVMREHREFRAFSKWMRVMIEVGVAGPGTKSATETEERETPNLDYSLLLAYINGTLICSRLGVFIEQLDGLQGSCSQHEFFDNPIVAQMDRKQVIRAIEKVDLLDETDDARNSKDVENTAANINLPALTVRLVAQVELAVEYVTAWQSKMLVRPMRVPLNGPLVLEADATVLDMRIFPLDERVESVTQLLTTSPPNRPSNELHLYSVSRLRASTQFEYAQLDVGILSGEILHAKMLDEVNCLVLLSSDVHDKHLLLRCNIATREAGQISTTVLQSWTSASRFTPERFLIGGRKRKMVCVVFGNQGKAWKVYDLESGDAKVGHGLAGDDEDEMNL